MARAILIAVMAVLTGVACGAGSLAGERRYDHPANPNAAIEIPFHGYDWRDPCRDGYYDHGGYYRNPCRDDEDED